MFLIDILLNTTNVKITSHYLKSNSLKQSILLMYFFAYYINENNVRLMTKNRFLYFKINDFLIEISAKTNLI